MHHCQSEGESFVTEGLDTLHILPYAERTGTMRQLRIAINVDALFGKVPGGGGMARVLNGLLPALAHIDTNNYYTLFAVRLMEPLPAVLRHLPPNFRLAKLPARKPQAVFFAWHTLRWPPVESFLGPHDIVHAPLVSVVPACRQAQLIVTVADMVWRRFPQGIKFWGRFFTRSGLHIGAREARVITTISQAVQQEVQDYFQHRFIPTKVQAIPLAADSFATKVPDAPAIRAVRAKYGLQTDYIIYVGTLEPRKNVERILQAYASLPAHLRTTYRLVLVGPYGWKVRPMQSMIEALSLHESVLWTGYVSDDELVALLHGATVFTYPSLYEGFGLPILEAMHCDVPVITANVSSMPEVAGDAALLVDPTSVEELTAALQRLLENAAFREHLVQRGRIQRAQFSWQRTAQAYLDLYQQVACSTGDVARTSDAR